MVPSLIKNLKIMFSIVSAAIFCCIGIQLNSMGGFMMMSVWVLECERVHANVFVFLTGFMTLMRVHWNGMLESD